MKIIVYGEFCFTNDSNNCSKNGELSMLYDVPKAWKNWNEEKRQEWLLKKHDKINKAFNDAMFVAHNEGYYDDIDE